MPRSSRMIAPGHQRTKMQALSVVIDPRIWLLEHQGLVTLDDKLLERAEIAFDELVNKVVDDTNKRTSDAYPNGWGDTGGDALDQV